MYRTLRFNLGNLEIRATLVWMLIAAALTMISVYVSVLPRFDGISMQSIFLAIAATGMLASLVIHEFAHVRAAARSGVVISALSPQLVGTLPDTLFEARDPASEVRVGIAGPVASLVSGGIAAAIWWATNGQVSSDVSSAVGLIALTNLGLAIVSLMPGYPFDGGRVARGVFWYLGGDLLTATKIVGYLGYVVIMAAMSLGVLLLVSGGTFAVWGVWVLLSAFVINRSVAEGISQVYWAEQSQRLRVDDIFVGGTRRIQVDITIDEAIERMLEGHEDGPLMVFDGDKAVGLVDLASIRPVPRKLWTERIIGDVMAPIDGLKSSTPSSPLSELIALLPPDRKAIALITRNDAVIGATDRQDVVRRLQIYLAAERLEKMRRGKR
jgi:Zn-dependent protease